MLECTSAFQLDPENLDTYGSEDSNSTGVRIYAASAAILDQVCCLFPVIELCIDVKDSKTFIPAIASQTKKHIVQHNSAPCLQKQTWF